MHHRRTQQPSSDLLHGPLFTKMLWFAVPLIITNLLQTLYRTADMLVVGLSGVEGAIGSIGTTAAMLTLLVNVFIGFSIGANVVVARTIGAGDREQTQAAVHTAMITGAAFGVVGLVIGELGCVPLLKLMGNEGRILELAALYSRIYIAGAPAMCITNYAAAIFRAKGDTRTPLLVLSISGIANVLMNLFFVLVCRMSVDGVAWATVLSNVISAVWLVLLLGKEKGFCRFDLRELQFSKKAFGDILYVGLPAGVQSSLFSISNMLIQSSLVNLNNTLYPGGSVILDGNAAADSLENFAYMATTSGYHTATTFASQHFGAGKHKRFGRVILDGYLLSTLIATVFSIPILLLRKPLVSLYVSDPATAEVAYTRMIYLLTIYAPLGWMEVGSGVLRGLGRSVTSTVVSLLGSCAFRILWISFVFPLFPCLECIFLSYPISWTLTALIHFICGQTVRRQYRPLGDAPDPEPAPA